jgi:histidyl-tRNA synthetase
MVSIALRVFNELGINVMILMNNRKILSGIADIIGEASRIIDITVAIDKLDKIGLEGVNKELTDKGLSPESINRLQPILALSGNNHQKLGQLSAILSQSETGMAGIVEMKKILEIASILGIEEQIELDLTLARGLNYYTGAIIEIKSRDVQMGSISGGGRYDDLTGVFGMKGMSGVGISFGADRIYDVLNELNLFPESALGATKALIINFGGNEEIAGLKFMSQLHNSGVSAELYPEPVKLKKQFTYADNKKIAYTIIIGTDEIASGKYQLKNMATGEQQSISPEEIIKLLAC